MQVLNFYIVITAWKSERLPYLSVVSAKFYILHNTANLGPFAVHKIVSKWGERIYAYME
jgi:hypothetical protein